MANKKQLSINRKGTVINVKSKKEDKQCVKAVKMVIDDLEKEFNIKLSWNKKILLTDIIKSLKNHFPNVEFAELECETSFMTPDGGITCIIDKKGNEYPLLIAEVKNQGTNDELVKQGKPKQAKGNAVERLGKNVIGFRTYMLNEGIFPFVCFGDGCDFEEGSSILDRVKTVAMFGELNKDYTTNSGINGVFNRGSYYFRNEKWTIEEMRAIMYDVAKKSVYYYFSKYGEDNYVNNSDNDNIIRF